MRAFVSIAAAVAGVSLAGAAAAAPAVVVPIDQSTRLNIGGSAYSVLVGSPEVADVTVVDSHTLFINGRSYGATDVVVLDRLGGTLYSGEIVVTAADVGRVSVYRGAARTDMACAPGCQVSARSAGGASAGGGSAGGAGPANLASALAATGGGGPTP